MTTPRFQTRRGFTLIELIVVLSIIVLVLGASVPMFNAIRGNRSVEAGYNVLASAINRSRAEAIGLARVSGVLFFLDATGRVNFTQVAATNRPPPAQDDPQVAVWLDVPVGAEIFQMPRGVGLQTLDVTPLSGGNRVIDSYIGFNPSPGGVQHGGVILFDARGILYSAKYAFRGTVDTSAGPQPSRISSLLNLAGSNFIPAGRPASQRGFTLFDQEPFNNLGYTRDDAAAAGRAYDQGQPTDEKTEEAWLDLNGLMALVRTNDGTLLRGEQ
jgi:prepilin-type N-terminal cleavage/methylation domain-containing protein